MSFSGNYITEIRPDFAAADISVYPYTIPAIRSLAALRLTQPVTFFTGENGSGKSTLLEAVAITYGFNPEGGSRNFRFRTKDTHSSLSECIKLQRGIKRPQDGFYLRAESFYNVATEIERIGDGLERAYGGSSLHEMSHGQSFLAVVVNRFMGHGLYILDEPESALSPVGQFALLSRIHELAKDFASQFIIATHSPLLLACPGAEIHEFSECGIERVEYEQTDAYVLYHRFFHDKKMLDELLRAEEPTSS